MKQTHENSTTTKIKNIGFEQETNSLNDGEDSEEPQPEKGQPLTL